MIKYGYIGDNEPVSNHLRFNKASLEFSHPWAAHIVGETFGSREYGKLIPIKDYFEMPVDLVEDILEGVARGEEKAAKARAAAIRRAESQAPSIDMDPNLSRLIKEGTKNVK